MAPSASVWPVHSATPVSSSAIPYDLPRAGDMVAPPPAPELPESSSSSAQPIQTILAIDVTKDGVVSIDRRAIVGDDDVLKIARAAKARDADVRAIIRADRNARWWSVIHLVDLLKQAGIAKIAFGVDVTPAPTRQP